MIKKHRQMIGYKIYFMIIIPTIYLIFINILSIFFLNNTSASNPTDMQFRKLLQIGLTTIEPGKNRAENCTPPAIKEFPSDGLTREQRQLGFILIHFVIAIYMFLLLAIVCDDFFVPSIKKICDKINVSEDVAGATIMATATSSPELFINIVGTFITEGDLGVGTIVGSAVFNILAVPACCGLFANQILNLEAWPVTRDTIAYAITVFLLILTLRDGRIEWYEALILVLSYFLYILVMCFDRNIHQFIQYVTRTKKKYKNLSEKTPLFSNDIKNIDINLLESSEEDESLEIVNMTNWPKSKCERIWWLITWPINFVLLITIPDCRRNTLKSWYPLTFIMCIIWIASTSYIVGWVITVIGDTFRIPDSIMGLTFLAAGMSVPEAVSSVIVANQGHGAMGISNSIGSNVFDVLLCLGLPWFLKAALFSKEPGNHYVTINSQGLVYSSISLFSTLTVLYLSLLVGKFKLTRSVGIICLTMYIIFLVFASILELNIFFMVNLPICID
ncbi:sodium/potassium/calcium exchanger 3 [Apis mellifera]|uniref:Sodium/potassium/calcium exchanger 3 n=1 Tax=Apis mellifera TaxID=7460 RepID=A0A7M7IKZ8_APIME|nr:sodium/potassium/calcium exchanger 3 [Apis mellifera]|eukprot:XP_016772943.1 sodium/potassium/calcium exchanger 3 [Apis mellifera]